MSWKMVNLGDVASFVNGYPFKPTDWSTDGLEIVRIQNLTKGSSETNYFKGSVPEKYKITKGDILISWSATLDIFVWDRNDAWLNQHIFKVVFDKIEIDKRFFIYLIKHILDDMRKAVHGATMQHITKAKFDNLKVPLPPLPIQKRIAEILDAADALKRKDQQLLQKYDELAQAIFIDMFGDPVKNEKGWKVKKLGEVCKIKGGKRLPLGNKLVKFNTGFPYIKAGNIKSGKVTLSDLEYLLPETQKKIKNYIVKEGDVCVTIVGVNIGDVGIVPSGLDGANLTENAAKIIVNDRQRINNVYLANYWSMPFVQNEITKRAMAVGVPKLALFRIEEIEIIIPPYSEQLSFNTVIEIINIHHKKTIQSQELSDNLFQTLLQKAFKGELVA